MDANCNLLLPLRYSSGVASRLGASHCGGDCWPHSRVYMPPEFAGAVSATVIVLQLYSQLDGRSGGSSKAGLEASSHRRQLLQPSLNEPAGVRLGCKCTKVVFSFTVKSVLFLFTYITVPPLKILSLCEARSCSESEDA